MTIINGLAVIGAMSLLLIAGSIAYGAVCEFRHQRAIDRLDQRTQGLSSRRNGQHVIPASASPAGRKDRRVR